jgi:hypothetical protein
VKALVSNEDLRFEKTIDTLLDEVTSEVGAKMASKCPAILYLYKVRETLRETNNAEIALALGIRELRLNKSACESCTCCRSSGVGPRA